MRTFVIAVLPLTTAMCLASGALMAACEAEWSSVSGASDASSPIGHDGADAAAPSLDSGSNMRSDGSADAAPPQDAETDAGAGEFKSATAVAVGENHACAVTVGGAAFCWGGNGAGELGNNKVGSTYLLPLPVSGLSSGVTAIAAGQHLTCAVVTDGAVKCWGANDQGQLGNATTTDSAIPVAVSGLVAGVTAIAAGREHACAIAAGGAVTCWGDNSTGQLGNGSNAGSDTPVAVTGLASGAKAISAGGDYACAVTSTGSVMCWGDNTFGQLGNNTSSSSTTPVSVVGLPSSVVAVSTGPSFSVATYPGAHACALTVTGSVFCWGSNTFGELGDGSTSLSRSAVAVSTISGVEAISVGRLHTCALTSAKTVKYWGRNNEGQLGDTTITNSGTPATAAGVSGRSFAVGYDSSCAVTTAGGVMCWGSLTNYGQIPKLVPGSGP